MIAPVKKARILVVEDEAIVARDIASQVQAMGYEAAGITGNVVRVCGQSIMGA